MFVFVPRKLSAALLLLACGGALAQSDPGTPPAGRDVRIEKDSAVGRVVAKVWDGRDGYVRIESREPGAPLNQHPVSIEPAALRELLTRVQLPAAHNEPVFNAAQLDEIVPPLSQALARVLPDQDISIAVSGRFALGGLVPRSVTTARVFYIDGRMNLIFGLVREDWENTFRGSGRLIPFEPGKRASMVTPQVKLAAVGGAVVRRGDWVQLDPAAPPPVAAPNAPSAAPTPAVVIPAQAPAPAPAPAAVVPVAPAASGPAPQPAAPGAPATTDGDALYRQTSERLKALQKLRDSGAITEEEYQQKRREILKGL